MANDDKKKKKKANGDTTALNMEPPGDATADSNANAERQPLTANNHHNSADADPLPVSDPQKEKLLAAEEGDVATTPANGGPKKPVLAKSGTIDRLQLRRKELEEHLRTRTGLSRQGLLWAMAAVMLLLLLAVITLSLAVAWPRIPHRLQYPACTSTPCLMSSAQVRTSCSTYARRAGHSRAVRTRGRTMCGAGSRGDVSVAEGPVARNTAAARGRGDR